MLTKLKIISEHGRKVFCECSCGATGLFDKYKVKNGHTKSCGCIGRERIKTLVSFRKDAPELHGMYGTKTYINWAGMIQRCTNPSSSNWKYYGARGITVCSAWRSFANFYADMGDAPEGATLDRIDFTAGYSKQNCRWASVSEQARNKCSNVTVTLNGKTQCLKDWCVQLGVSYTAVHQRITKLGWEPVKALSTPIRQITQRKKVKQD